MKIKQIIIGAIIIVALIVLGIIVLKTDIIFKDSSIDLAAENLKVTENQKIKSQVSSEIRVTVSNMSELSEYLTFSERNDFEIRISELFADLFPYLSTISSDYASYYNQNSDEIQNRIGIDSEEEFISLIHKLNRIQSYETCTIVLIPESLEVIENNYLMNINVIYDEVREVEFYMILDLKNLQIKIK